jgi:hypothetical protein
MKQYDKHTAKQHTLGLPETQERNHTTTYTTFIHTYTYSRTVTFID